MAIPKGSIKAGKPKKAKAIQEGQIKKKGKEAKFKQTPQGKVPLVHNKKNGNANSQKEVNKQSPQQQSKKKQLNFANKSKNNSSKSQSPHQKKASKKKNKVTNKVVEGYCTDEDESEGELIPEVLRPSRRHLPENRRETAKKDDDDSEVSSQNDSTPNIFGESLADDTDEDDDDFEAESEDETPGEKKGVKMFKGVKSNKKQKTEASDDDDEDDDDDDDDDNDDDDDDDEEEDEDEDEDFNVRANVSQMEFDSDENDDDEDDDDDDEDDDDDDEDDDDDGPGLKALIGQSLVDDDDDEDFEGEEDEDDDDDEEIEDSDEEENTLNSSTQSNNSSTLSSPSTQERAMLSPAEKKKVDDRTIFIGNVPKEMKESRLKSEFGKFGPIESLRIRGVVPESPNMTYKAAAITKKFHPKSKTVCVFIVYKSEDSVLKALDMNGKQLDGNYLRVERVNHPKDIDSKKAVFLGNLAFDTEENDLWTTFKKCGDIESVKTNRDRMTGACRGTGYIIFKQEDAVALALDLDGFKLNKRDVRVSRYNPNSPKKNQNSGQKRMSKQQHTSGSKKPKMDDQSNDGNNGNSMKSKKKEKKAKTPSQQSDRSDDSFQGQTASAKKKGKKGNKFEKKKKVMAGKLLSKPKKPQ